MYGYNGGIINIQAIIDEINQQQGVFVALNTQINPATIPSAELRGYFSQAKPAAPAGPQHRGAKK